MILRRGAGWTVPDYMPEDAEPIGILQARRLIESMEADGAPALRPESVTWDTAISAPSKVNLAVYVTEALPPLGCGHGDPVRVTIRRLEPREGGEDDEGDRSGRPLLGDGLPYFRRRIHPCGAMGGALMTILIAIRDDWTADMLEYDAAPEEAACLMPEDIGGDHIRAIYDITDGTPAFL